MVNNESIKSFINFCDDMQVANEGSIIQMTHVFKDLKRKVTEIQKNIQNADGRPEEQLKYYKEYNNVLSEAETAINNIPVGKLENPYVAFLTALVPLFASIAVSVVWMSKTGTGSQPIRKISDLKEISPLLAGAVGTPMIAIKSGTRETCLNYINESRRVTAQIIAYLESGDSAMVDSDVKNGKEYQKSLFRNARKANNKKIKELINTIFTEMKSIIMKSVSPYGLSINVFIDEECLITELMKSGNINKLKSIVSSALREVSSKHTLDINRYGIVFSIENSEPDTVEVYYRM